MSTPLTKRFVPLIKVQSVDGYGWTSTRWLRDQVSKRTLAFHKVQGRVLINLDDLDRMVAAGRVDART